MENGNCITCLHEGKYMKSGKLQTNPLTPISCKILETCNIQQHNTDARHGFRKRRFWEKQLFTTINNWAKCLNNNEQIDAVLLYFSKAFDKAAHSSLLQKLDNYGTRGSILKWVQYFLSSITQQMVLEGSSSDISLSHLESLKVACYATHSFWCP